MATQQSLKEKTAKGLFWGGLSNGIQQLLILFFGIFISRILNAEDYGMVGMLTIFSAIAGIIQDSGFTIALINKKDATSADYNAVFWFSTFIGLTLYIILFFCAPLIARFYNVPALTPLARFAFLGFLIGCVGTVHNAILTKRIMIKEKAKCTLTALFLSGVTGVIMAVNGMSYWGIVTQNIMYMFVSISLIWYYSPWRPTFHFNFHPLKKMFSFSIKVLVTNVFVQINANIFSVLLGRFFNPAQVGYYTQGNKWMIMGNTFIGTMVNNVAQPVLAEVNTETDRQKKIFRKMLRFISFVSFPLMFGLALIAPEFILITVTAKWLPSVPILQLLCIWGAVTPLHNLYSNMIVSQGKSNIFMWNNIGLGIMQFLILFFTASFGIYTMIIGFIIINILWLFIWQYFALLYIRLTWIEALKDILPYAFLAGTSIIIAYVSASFFTNIYIVLIVKIFFAIISYCFFLWISNSVIFQESISFLFRKNMRFIFKREKNDE